MYVYDFNYRVNYYHILLLYTVTIYGILELNYAYVF